MRRYSRTRFLTTTVDLVGQSGRLPIPRPRRPRITRTYKLRQQLCRPRQRRELLGVSFCGVSRRFSAAEQILLECVSRQPHCSNNRPAGRKWLEPPTSLSAITLGASVSESGAPGARTVVIPQTPNSAEERKRVARLEGVARRLYQALAAQDPDRLITLCDGSGRVVARHDPRRRVIHAT